MLIMVGDILMEELLNVRFIHVAVSVNVDKSPMHFAFGSLCLSSRVVSVNLLIPLFPEGVPSLPDKFDDADLPR